MSSSHDIDTSPSAKEIKAQAADWLQRRNFWNWTAEDEDALEAWLAQSLSHRVGYWRLRSAWERSEKLTALRDPSFGKGPQTLAQFWPISRVMGIAAVIVAACAIGGAYLYPTPPGQAFATPIGGREVLSLSDGSQVELNTDTMLRTDINGDHRAVYLEKGEAFFQVVHDAKRPFVVYAGDRRITDLGTKFSVRRQSDRLEVALVEGRARFDATADTASEKPTFLVPGDILVATAKSTSLTRRPNHELERALSWRQGFIVFNHTTLEDAAQQFNRYNTERIVITDPAVARLTIDGTFPINGVHAFARVTNVVFKLRAEKHNGQTVLSR